MQNRLFQEDLKLSVEHVFTEVQGDTFDLAELTKILTFSQEEDAKSLFNDQTNTFLTGLLPHVLQRLAKQQLPYNISYEEKVFDYYEPFILGEDGRTKDDLPELPEIPVDYLEGITLRTYQPLAALTAIKHERGTIHVATRGGKTEIAGCIMKYLDLPSIFLINRKGLMTQTYNRFLERGMPKEKIAMIGGSKKINQDAKFFVVTSQTLLQKIKKRDPFVLDLLRKTRVLILDEAQFAPSKGWMMIACACSNASYRFALSGTPFTTIDKSSIRDKTVIGVTGDVIVSIPYTWLKENGYVSSAEVHIVPIYKRPSERVDSEGMKQKFTNDFDWHQVYKEGVAHNFHWNKLVCDMSLQYLNANKKVLILVREHIHARNLMKMYFEEFKQQVCYSAGGDVYSYYDGTKYIRIRDYHKQKRKGKRAKKIPIEFETIIESLEKKYNPSQKEFKYDIKRGHNNYSVYLEDENDCALAYALLRKVKLPAKIVDTHNIQKPMEDVKAMYEPLPRFILIGSPIYKFGADLPYIDTVINMAAGRGLVPTIQSMSRGTTLFEGKEKCIMLDFDPVFSYVLTAQCKAREKLYKHEGYDVIRQS